MSLKDLRVRAGLTQWDVARALQVDQSAVSYWERGRNPPLAKYHEPLARLYGVSVEELIAAQEMKRPG